MSTRPDIRHVVVLMMENRSFDHLLGHLNLDQRNLPQNPPVNYLPPGDPNGVPCTGSEYAQDLGPEATDLAVDPGHSHRQIVEQVQGQTQDLALDRLTMGGFAQAYRDRLEANTEDLTDVDLNAMATAAMGWHPAQNIPTLAQLALEYTVCSKWFSSVPGETWPNRMFAHMGHSHNMVHNAVHPYTDPSIFDILAEQGVEFAVYGQDIPQAAFHLGWKDVLFRDRLNSFDDFLDDVADGTLPQYSFIEPHHLRAVNSQHPCHRVILGDQFIAKIYRALTSSPSVWEHLLFIITWDEHGGLYDHEPPIPAAPPFPGNHATDTEEIDGRRMRFAFDVTGARVPALVISPWAQRGHVCADVAFDHTSIIKTVLETFGISDGAVRGRLGNRVTQAEGLGQILSQTSLPAVRLGHPSGDMVRVAVRERALADQTLASLDELDSFQKSLLEEKQFLDTQRGIDYIGPAAAGETPPQALDRLINEFKTAHVTPRSARIAAPIPEGGMS